MWLLKPTSSLQALLHINPVHSHMASQTCYRPSYFITELTQITCSNKLLVGTTCVKSACDCLLSWDLKWQANTVWDKQTLLQMLQICSGWKIVCDQCQLLFPKCLIQDRAFDSPYFESFTTIVDQFYAFVSVKCFLCSNLYKSQHFP